MMRRALPTLLLVSLALTAGTATGTPAAQAPGPGSEEAAAAEFQELEQAYREARSAYRVALAEQSATRKEDPDAELPALVDPDPEFVTRFRQAAKRHAGTERSTGSLIRALELSYRRDAVVAKEILGELLDDHMASEKLPGIRTTLTLGAFYLGDDTVREALGRIIDESPHPVVQAAFLFTRGALVVRARDSTAEQRAAAAADLERAIELGAGSPYADLAKAAKFELEHLQVGRPAPEIEGEDLDGVPFKLSDYRGKVVVLDFWGDW